VKTWKVILVACLIFGTGVAAGILAGNLVQQGAFSGSPVPDKQEDPPVWRSKLEDHRQKFCNRLSHHLELTPEQEERIESILEESQTRVEAILKPVGPKIHDEYKAARDQIRAILNPGQRDEFDKVFHPRHLRKRGSDKDREHGHKEWGDRKPDWDDKKDRDDRVKDQEPEAGR
jgi:Spy/CpxP family protein refolding chaperone